MNPDLIILFVGEIFIILALYRFILRQWVVAEWEQKFEDHEWLVDRLSPVIDEIDDRMHDKLQDFQNSFFGSVGSMTKKAQGLDPMNGLRKAAKSGNWAEMLVEYAANRAGLGGLLAPESEKTVKNSPKTALTKMIPKPIKDIFKL
jgi:hypothetical protein